MVSMSIKLVKSCVYIYRDGVFILTCHSVVVVGIWRYGCVELSGGCPVGDSAINDI